MSFQNFQQYRLRFLLDAHRLAEILLRHSNFTCLTCLKSSVRFQRRLDSIRRRLIIKNPFQCIRVGIGQPETSRSPIPWRQVNKIKFYILCPAWSDMLLNLNSF
jgi:hypothetical protein